MVETGTELESGDRLYLSTTEAGTVTNILPGVGICQIIGTCISVSSGTYKTLLASLSGVQGNLYHDYLLNISGGDGVYYYHVGHDTFHNIGDGTHNQLAGTQGGSAAERYHVNLSQYTALTAFGGNHNNCPAGLQGGSITERYHLSSSQYTNIGDGTHNGLAGIQGGAAGERYHLTLSQYTNLVGLPSGTKLLFCQATAPVGWTQDTTFTDRLIRVVNNGTDGGLSGGSWTISGLTGATHTHNTQGHVLTINEMPRHRHGLTNVLSTTMGAGGHAEHNYDYQHATYTDYTGGDLAHDHGATTGTAVPINSDSTWRPAYVNVIVARKN